MGIPCGRAGHCFSTQKERGGARGWEGVESCISLVAPLSSLSLTCCTSVTRAAHARPCPFRPLRLAPHRHLPPRENAPNLASQTSSLVTYWSRHSNCASQMVSVSSTTMKPDPPLQDPQHNSIKQLEARHKQYST